VQQAFVRSIKGFERAHITRPGYAIEYDFFDPRDLHPTLETKHVPGLYFAGQNQRHHRYEEAAAQGCSPASMRACRCRARAVVPDRGDAYIGVMVDDLITRGAPEPYRMFTSRAEYRLTLRRRQRRPPAHASGPRTRSRRRRALSFFEHKRVAVDAELERLHASWVRPARPPPSSSGRFWVHRCRVSSARSKCCAGPKCRMRRSMPR